MRSIIYRIVLSALVLVVAACELTKTEPGDAELFLSAPVHKSPLSNELMSLVDIREEITIQALAAKADPVLLMEAYLAQDQRELQRLMAVSDNQLADWKLRLEQAAASFQNNYPELRSTGVAVEACDVEQFFMNYDQFIQRHQRGNSGLGRIAAGASYDDGVECEWGVYTASLVACVTAGPFMYWVCSYIALCSFCEGGYVDDICM